MRTLRGALGANRASQLHDGWDLYRLIDDKVAEAGSAAAFCRRHGLSTSYLSMVRNATREPSDDLLRALGMRRIVRYELVD